MGSDKAGGQHPDPHPEIERGQVGRSGRTAHMVRSDIHEKTLKSRYTHAKTDTDRQGASEKDKRCMYGSEHGKRDR